MSGGSEECVSGESLMNKGGVLMLASLFSGNDLASVFELWKKESENLGAMDWLTIIGVFVVVVWMFFKCWKDWHLSYQLNLWLEYFLDKIPMIDVEMTDAEARDDGIDPSLPPKVIPPNLEKENKQAITCWDPSTMQFLGHVHAMTPQDVDNCCQLASKAQKRWVNTTFRQRRQVLLTIQKYIVAHVHDICRVCTRDSGKTIIDALLGEVMTTCEKIRTICAEGEIWLQPSYRSTGPLMMHKHVFVQYVPLGVLGVISPWNYPFHNMLNHVISGIFAGNAIVCKVSEHTSWSAAYFGRIIRSALEAHGHDPDLVQTVTGFGDAGAALVQNSLVKKVIFTGSPNVGRKVMAGAAPHLKPVILELGGKDPMIFRNDVSLPAVIPWAMRGCFQNCGQNCCGVERLVVYESIHDEFIQAILPKIQALRQGPSLCNEKGDVDCGAMVMDQQCDLIQELIDDAVKKGATVHAGGKRNADLRPGQFYMPTLISGITPDMRIAQEEVFGPVMAVSKIPNDDDDVCIKWVNSCPFGLGASVYSQDVERARYIGRSIKSGMVTVNDFGVNYLVQSLPFGGTDESGFGRFAGPEGLRACCLERSVVLDAIPGVHTSIPKPIDYPIDTKRGLGFGTSLIQLFYSDSIKGKIQGIIGLIKFG